MFTGLVRQRGTLIDEPRRSEHGGVRLRIRLGEALTEELGIGASLAVAGVCLTVVELSPGGRVLSALELSKDRHPQAEGIAFGPDGRLYLSDEGHGRRARLTVYAPRQETPSGGEDPCPGA